MSSINGTFIAYEPQWKDGDAWKRIDYKQQFGTAATPARGFHYPAENGGICQQAWLCGHAQAQAIAWAFACEWEAANFKHVEVRILPQRVKFTIDTEPYEPG